MADITIRNTFAAGVSEASKVQENFYRAHATTPDSFEVINGHLEEANLDPTTGVGWKETQPGTFVRAWQVGANSAFDVFDDAFGRRDFNADLSVALSNEEDTLNLVPIIGSAKRFYCPWSANVLLLSWSCFWGTDLVFDSNAVGLCAPVYLFKDGAFVSNFTARRVAPASVYDATPGNAEFFVRDARLDQRWNGHYTIANLSRGWHDVSLRIGISDARTEGPAGYDIAQQARVRCRQMTGIIFRG